MAIKALSFDFYGTLVREDDVIISVIVAEIARTSPVSSDPGQIEREWYNHFISLCGTAFGETFRLQREIEIESLTDICARYQTSLDIDTVQERLFAYWQAPDIFEDARSFIESNSLPICIASNIDTNDVLAAILSAGWQFDWVVTSESSRSYKPRSEIFACVLELLNCEAHEVLHIGDSLSNDVAGAQQLGIPTVWVNRKNKPLPDHISAPTYTVRNLTELTACLTQSPLNE